MLNLSFIFDDAIRAVANYGKLLQITPLPSTVYLMQVDVINHYRRALDHFLTLDLNEPSLQNSSLGTPYEKWAYFANRDFQILSFTVQNLLRYTSRLFHETECRALQAAKKFAEAKNSSNRYTDPICEIGYHGKSVGVTIHLNHRLSIVSLDNKPDYKGLIHRGSTADRPPTYSRTVTTADGKETEEPLTREEYQLATATVRSETIDIQDRSQLPSIVKQGHEEVAILEAKNDAFAKACNKFYRWRTVAEPFNNLNQEYWI